MAKASSRMQNAGQDYEEKFPPKLKEKYESSKQGGGEASFRVLYYGGGAGSVPFMWESQPGTPKHQLHDNPLPPLTPPPSYQFIPGRSNPLQKKNSKNSKFFNSIFPRVSSKKISASPASLSPPASPPSSYSLPSTPLNARGKNNFRARSRSAVHFGLDEDEYEAGTNSPTSTLCFGPRNESPLRRFKGYSSPIKSVKKVVLSIVGGN